MLLKIDVVKAFDKLEWGFIHHSLCFFRFPRQGIRQRDPLSPYLLFIFMELLSRSIHLDVNCNLWSSVKLKAPFLPLSYLFFADAIILTYRITPLSCKVVRDLIDFF